ncbi:hypothetical protein pb186bvf_019713 [Paramecium bursaria]
MEQFIHMHEKLMLSDMQSVHWSKTMDICAVLYKNNSIEVYRVGEQLQKLFVIDEEEQITNVEVEANFIFYTYGTKLSAYDLSTHSQVIHTNIRYEPIQGLFLIPVDIQPIKQKKIFQRLIPLPNTQLKNWQNLSFLKSKQQNYITLTTHENMLHISLNGITELSALQDIRVNYVQHSKNELHLFTETQIKVYNFTDFRNPKELKYMQQHSYLQQMLSFLKSSVVAVNNSLADINKIFQLNISGLDRFQDIQPINQQFLIFYQRGECSPQLLEFFQKDLYNTKIVPKLDERMQGSLNFIQEIIQESVLNVLQEQLQIITKIENFIGKELPYTHQNRVIWKVQSYIKIMSQLFVKFQLECHQTKLHLRNFCIWLNKCAIKSQPETDQECENINHPLGKMEVNLEMLYDFLIDDHLFNLKNLQCFFNEKIGFKSFFSDTIIRKKTDQPIQRNVIDALQTVFQTPIGYPTESYQIQGLQLERNITQIIRDMQNNLESVTIKKAMTLIRTIDIGPLRPLFSKTEDDYTFINFGREIQEFYYKKGAFLPGQLLNLQIDDGQFYNQDNNKDMFQQTGKEPLNMSYKIREQETCRLVREAYYRLYWIIIRY